jgi:hypothetical protein
MKTPALILLALLLAATAHAQQPRTVQASTASATRDQITANLTFGTGRVLGFSDTGLLRSTNTTDATDATGTTGSLGTLGGLSVAKIGRFGTGIGVGAAPTAGNPLYLKASHAGAYAAIIWNESTSADASANLALIMQSGKSGGLSLRSDTNTRNPGMLELSSGSSSSGIVIHPGLAPGVKAALFANDRSSTFYGTVSSASGRLVKVTGNTATTLTLDSTHHVVTLSNSDPVTVTLPAAASHSGREYRLKNIGAGTVTIDANASELIDDATTLALAQWDAVFLYCNGTQWFIF